jgi:hypothetical protein
MHSDKTVYYTYKYLPSVCGAFTIVVTLLMHVFPENSTVNGEPGPPDQLSTLILILIGLVFLFPPILYVDKLVRVEIGYKHILYQKEEQGLADRMGRC